MSITDSTCDSVVDGELDGSSSTGSDDSITEVAASAELSSARLLSTENSSTGLSKEVVAIWSLDSEPSVVGETTAIGFATDNASSVTFSDSGLAGWATASFVDG